MKFRLTFRASSYVGALSCFVTKRQEKRDDEDDMDEETNDDVTPSPSSLSPLMFAKHAKNVGKASDDAVCRCGVATWG